MFATHKIKLLGVHFIAIFIKLDLKLIFLAFIQQQSKVYNFNHSLLECIANI